MAGRTCCWEASIITGDATDEEGRGDACNDAELVDTGVTAFGRLVTTMDGTLPVRTGVIVDDGKTYEPPADEFRPLVDDTLE